MQKKCCSVLICVDNKIKTYLVHSLQSTNSQGNDNQPEQQGFIFLRTLLTAWSWLLSLFQSVAFSQNWADEFRPVCHQWLIFERQQSFLMDSSISSCCWVTNTVSSGERAFGRDLSNMSRVQVFWWDDLGQMVTEIMKFHSQERQRGWDEIK